MKRASVALVIALFVTFCFFCAIFHKLNWRHNHNLSFNVVETGNTYQLSAYYNRNQTYRIQKYLDAQLHTNQFFSHSNMDAMVTLEDNTSVYVKTSPGRLFIKLDKRENDADAYLRIKQLGEKIKQNLAND